MARKKSKPVVHYAPLSGALGGELQKHAYERCRHFFFYEFYAKALVDYLNTHHAQSLEYEDVVLVKASHQIDAGFRGKESVRHDFDPTDPNVLNVSCTAFRNVDAAHFCNLGIKDEFRTLAAGFADDAKALDLYERLKSMAGNTRWLPKRVNVGPDRVIDNLHGEFAVPILTNTKHKLISRDNMRAYVAEAQTAMTAYKVGQKKQGNAGVAACANCYLECYAEEGIVKRLYADIHCAVAGDCWGLGLPQVGYLD